MSDSVQPHRRQPTRLSCPWDSPGKNTGVGCHFLLQCMKVKSEREVTQLCPTLCDPMDCSLPGSSMGFARQEYWSGVPLPSPTETLLLLLSHFSCVQLCVTTRLPHPWDSPGKNTGVGCHFLLQCMKVRRLKSQLQWPGREQTQPSSSFVFYQAFDPLSDVLPH